MQDVVKSLNAMTFKEIDTNHPDIYTENKIDLIKDKYPPSMSVDEVYMYSIVMILNYF